MADRTSAKIFADVLTEIAASPGWIDEAAKRQLAANVYVMTREYDFTTGQMCIDHVLEDLGLAREVGEDEDGETVMQYRDPRDTARWEPVE